MAASHEHYSAAIREAYIDPIRSVLIIDDEYPTLDGLLEQEINDRPMPESWKTNALKSQAVMYQFRERDPSLIIDVHNGVGIDTETPSNEELSRLASHLHQSDLLILDFELEDHGEKAKRITKELLDNAQFNLIVVNTAKDLNKVFSEMLLELMSGSQELKATALTSAFLDSERMIEDQEDEDPDFLNKLGSAVSFDQYSTFRQSGWSDTLSGARNGKGLWGSFASLCREKNWVTDEDVKKVLSYALQKYETKELSNKSQPERRNLSWSAVNSQHLWIRTSMGFITFVGKQNAPNLIESLHDALLAWQPSPSRLLSARLRAEIGREGVVAEDVTLKGPHIHAQFYEQLSSTIISDEERRSLIDSQLDRQMDSLAQQVKPTVSECLKRLVDLELKQEKSEQTLSNAYRVKLSDSAERKKSLNAFNSYVSCKAKIGSWHLEPGHVFNLGDETWVCVSQACDLVPGQGTKNGIFADAGDMMPFTALKLHPTSGPKGAEVGSNKFLFIPASENTEDVKVYRVFPQGKAEVPHWNIFFATKSGKLNGNKFSLCQLTRENRGEKSQGRLVTQELETEVVAQLRYEYALNLIHKLNTNLTRVGLGFVH